MHKLHVFTGNRDVNALEYATNAPCGTKVKYFYCGLLVLCSVVPVYAAPVTPVFRTGMEDACNYDADQDRLSDCIETGTNSYVGTSNTGTARFNPDTDFDGLLDGDEVLGTLAGLNLPAMGTNPLRRDLLVEYDWFDDANDCAAHSHRPTQAILDQTAAAYAAMAIANPNGTSGINLIQDAGQGGLFTGGNLVADADGIVDGLGAEFYGYKTANFANNRANYFHYAMFPHRYGTATNGSSGLASLNGRDLIVSLYCANSTGNVRNTIVHEMGHNLGLRHGGNVNCNYKPNYNSVMNYRYQFPGANNNCLVPGNGAVAYSSGTRITLNENSLLEMQGVCGFPNPSVDWNNNGTVESGIVFDINSADTGQASACGGTLTTMSDFNDYAALNLRAVSVIGLNGGALLRSPNEPEELAVCQEVPFAFRVGPESGK